MTDNTVGALARWIHRLRGRLDPEGEAARVDIRRLARHLPALTERTTTELRAQREAVKALEHGLAAERAQMDALARDVAWTRRAVTRLRRVNGDLLRRAGLDQRTAAHEQRLRDRLTRLTRSKLPIVVGPWTGEVGFELLYWIPFLQGIRDAYPIDPERLIIISRGGVRDWYSHVGGTYVDAFSTVTPEDFRAATEAIKKQRNPRAFEKLLLRAAMRERGLQRAHLLHPSLMYELLWSYWSYRATLRHVDEFLSFRRIPAVSRSMLPPGLPREYVAARFYFSDCFPDAPPNREFIQRILDRLTSRTDVVLLNTPFAVDDHTDFSTRRSERIHLVADRMEPVTNLGVQTAIIANARAFVGTYGGYAYLAPLCGVHSTAFYSRTTFKRQHLDLAHRVFERLGSARLLPVDVRAIDAAELAFGGDVRVKADTTEVSPGGVRL